MRRARPLFATLALLGLLSGCQTTAVKMGGVPRAKVYKSVVSLSPSTTEIIGGAGNVQILKGRTQADNWPEYATKSVPVVAGVKPDYEKVRGIKPDLVVVDGDLYNEVDMAKIKELGAEVFVLDAQTLDQYMTQVADLGVKIAQETTISGYLDKVQSAAEVSRTETPARRPKTAIALGGDFFAGTEGFLGDVVRIAGGEPVGPRSAKFAKFGAEELVAAAPTLMIVPVSKTDAEGAQALVDGLLKDPRYASVPAIRNRNIVAMDADMVLRRGYRVNQLIEGLHRVVIRTANR